MSEKTGYLMLNREWDLDWRTIVQATKLVDTKQMDLEDFRTTIFVYHPEFDWMTIETAAAGGSVQEEEGRRKIVAFKEELTALGKENLFFRWIELVQYESSRGEFGPDQQLKTMQKAKDMVSQILNLIAGSGESRSRLKNHCLCCFCFRNSRLLASRNSQQLTVLIR